MPFQRDPIIEDEASPFDDEDENLAPPAWLVTFGDTISLLLTFFVLLLSFSSFDSLTQQMTTVSFNSNISVGELNTGGNIKRLDLSNEISHENTELDKFVKSSEKDGSLQLSDEMVTQNLLAANQNEVQFTIKELKKLIDENNLKDGIQVEKDENEIGFSVTIDQGVAFREGKTTLKSSAYAYLKKIALLLNDIPNDIIITGYCNEALTCPPEKLKEQQFRLAILRADKIARYLIKVAHITPARISTTGYGGELKKENADPKAPPKAPSRVSITLAGTFDGYLLTFKNNLFVPEDLP